MIECIYFWLVFYKQIYRDFDLLKAYPYCQKSDNNHLYLKNDILRYDEGYFLPYTKCSDIYLIKLPKQL